MSGAIRVVIADDAEDMRLVLRVTLETDDRFHVVGEAGDGRDVVRLCGELCPDAVVLDLQMPSMSGADAIPLIREVCPDTAVVVYTAYADLDSCDRLLAAGATAVLSKLSTPMPVLVEHIAVSAARASA
jgi:two-component system nitrate/nitrite response regulator NarL